MERCAADSIGSLPRQPGCCHSVRLMPARPAKGTTGRLEEHIFVACIVRTERRAFAIKNRSRSFSGTSALCEAASNPSIRRGEQGAVFEHDIARLSTHADLRS